MDTLTSMENIATDDKDRPKVLLDCYDIVVINLHIFSWVEIYVE